MTEIPISSDVINVESCNKDFLEALERLFHLAYNNLTSTSKHVYHPIISYCIANCIPDLYTVCCTVANLMFDLFKVQRLCNLTFDLGSGKRKLIFFKLFLQRP